MRTPTSAVTWRVRCAPGPSVSTTPTSRCAGRCEAPVSHCAARSHASGIPTPDGRNRKMPRMSKADAPVSLDEPEIEGRYAELGEYTVAFETHKADVDPAPFFQGLPDDR